MNREPGKTSRPGKPIFIALVSLGCAKNLVDSEVMAGTLAAAGYVLTGDADLADVLLINTCSFIGDARAEAQAEIHRALAWKKRRRGRRIVVTGCLPQRDLARTREQFPAIDLFAGLDDVPRIADMLNRLTTAKGSKTTAPTAFAAPQYLYDEQSPRLLLTPKNYAFVKIAEGCDHGCRFCAIPAIRGRQRSRSVASIVSECRTLLERGTRELNFIAQDTTRYGHDRNDGATLSQLLRECDRLDGDFWLRVLYTHPRYFTPDLLATFAAARHLVRYIDIPLQHIADAVLKSMGRAFGETDTRHLMDRLRQNLPGAAIRTTFLVGYPGETEADFDLLLRFLKDFRFERVGVFVFSPEEGTAAAEITTDLVPPEVAEDRRRQLLEAQQAISLARNRSLVGQTCRVLLDSSLQKGLLAGRTYADAPEVDNLVKIHGGKALLDQAFAEVRITAATEYDLTGEAVEP